MVKVMGVFGSIQALPLQEMFLDQHLHIPGRNKDYTGIFLWQRN